MAMFNFTVALEKGVTFIFGSWVSAVNFRRYLVDDKKLEAAASTRSCDLDDFIDNLDEMLLPDLIRELE
jgi:hypothetical protein